MYVCVTVNACMFGFGLWFCAYQSYALLCAPHNYRVRLAATFDNYLHYNFPCWPTAAFSAIKAKPSPKNDAMISNVATST